MGKVLLQHRLDQGAAKGTRTRKKNKIRGGKKKSKN